MADLLRMRLLVSETMWGIGRRRRRQRTVYVVVASFEAVIAIVVVVFSMSDEIFESVNDAGASGHSYVQ